MIKFNDWFLQVFPNEQINSAVYYKLHNLCDRAMLKDNHLKDLGDFNINEESRKKFEERKNDIQSMVLSGDLASEGAKRILFTYFVKNFDKLELGVQGMFFNCLYHIMKYQKFTDDSTKEWRTWIDQNLPNCEILVLDNFDPNAGGIWQKNWLETIVQRRNDLGKITILVNKTGSQNEKWRNICKKYKVLELKEIK